jgi:predicted Co/Zn/Cd cation transporter (cation efflux family)
MPASTQWKACCAVDTPSSSGPAIAWAAILGVVGPGMAAFMRRQSRRLSSPLLAMDSRSWMVSALLSFALLVGFGIAIAMEGTAFAHWIPLVDPAVLLAVSMLTLPVPLMGTVRAFREILQVSPSALDLKVRAVMEAMVLKHGFLEYHSHVQKMGRGQFIEIHVLLPEDYALDAHREGRCASRRDLRAIGGRHVPHVAHDRFHRKSQLVVGHVASANVPRTL